MRVVDALGGVEPALLTAALGDYAAAPILADRAEELGLEGYNILRLPGLWVVQPVAGEDYAVVGWAAGDKGLAVGKIAYGTWGDVPKCTTCRYTERAAQFVWGDVPYCSSCLTQTLLGVVGLDAVKRLELYYCPACEGFCERLVGDGCCKQCKEDGMVRGRRGWRRLGEYDG